MIKKIKIVTNNEEKSIKTKEILYKYIKDYNFIEVENNPDLVISIGGDGTFIKSLKETNFNTDILYVGIHTGHLGFLQEVQINQIKQLFDCIILNNYKIETLSTERIEVITNNGLLEFFALNEMVMREEDLKTLKFEVTINNKHFENFAGDGIMISTPTGSTAYNLSSGGSIIYPSLKTLQLLPLSPLPMSKHYSSLNNSVVVPENMTISLLIDNYYKEKIKLIIDGENISLDFIEKINITTASKGINVLRFNNYDFFERINEKFLKLN